MLSKARVTSKGQLTIPKEIREAMKIAAGDDVIFCLREGRAYIERVPSASDVDDLYGILHDPEVEPVELEDWRRRYYEDRARRHAPPGEKP